VHRGQAINRSEMDELLFPEVEQPNPHSFVPSFLCVYDFTLLLMACVSQKSV
jgi:hypothetical protein